jgi:SprT protein
MIASSKTIIAAGSPARKGGVCRTLTAKSYPGKKDYRYSRYPFGPHVALKHLLGQQWIAPRDHFRPCSLRFDVDRNLDQFLELARLGVPGGYYRILTPRRLVVSRWRLAVPERSAHRASQGHSPGFLTPPIRAILKLGATHRTMNRLLAQLLRIHGPRRHPTVPNLPTPLAATFSDWTSEWSSLWSTPDLPTTITVAFSNRLTSALGRCTPRTGSIRLNPKLLEAPREMLREVLCHEAAHVAAWLLHGRRARPHGREWKDLMRVAGYEPRVKWKGDPLASVARSSGRPSTLYVHSCPVCSASRLARRPVPRWRCQACRDAGLEGRLEITRRVGTVGWSAVTAPPAPAKP